MVEIRSVRIDTTVGGVDFLPIDITVERMAGINAGHVRMEGIIDGDPGELTEDMPVEVAVSGTTLFTGLLKRATQDEDETVTIEAYDRLIELQQKRVILETERPRKASNIIRDLLGDAGIDDYRLRGPFPGGDTMIDAGFGSGKAGEPLGDTIRRLANNLSAVVWVTRENTLVVEAVPAHDFVEIEHITEVEGGLDADDTKQVIVHGGGVAGEHGLAVSHLYSKLTSEGSASLGGDEDKSRSLNEQNVVTKKGVDSRATSEVMQDTHKNDAGQCTVVGDPEIDIWDSIEIPEFQSEQSIPLSAGVYSAREVRHIMNNSEGYVTEINLAPDTASILQDISDPSGVAAQWVSQWLSEEGRGGADTGTLGGGRLTK